MLQTYEALLEPDGHLRFIEQTPPPADTACRVLVTLVDSPGAGDGLCGAHLSEPALAVDWLRPEEDAAWAHLQSGR